MSSQCAAVASQNFTAPGVTGVLPAVTVAVSVTALPHATVVTALPPEVTASVAVVAAPPAYACCATPQRAIGTIAARNNRQSAFVFTVKLHSRCRSAAVPSGKDAGKTQSFSEKAARPWPFEARMAVDSPVHARVLPRVSGLLPAFRSDQSSRQAPLALPGAHARPDRNSANRRAVCAREAS